MKLLTKICACILLLSTIIAGCSTVPKGEEVEVVYIGSINASGDSFQMNGYLSSGGGVAEQERFRTVTVQLYAENGDLLCEREIGSLQADAGRLNVSVAANVVPQYVLITSPDFWDEQVEVNYFQRKPNGESYDREDVTSESELPVSAASSDGGACSK